MARKEQRRDPAAEAVAQGWRQTCAHPLFRPLVTWHVSVSRASGNLCPPDGWAVIDAGGTVHVHPTRRAEPDQWAWVFAHLLLHLGFGQVEIRSSTAPPSVARAAACEVVVHRLLRSLGIGRPVLDVPDDLPASDEVVLEREWARSGVPVEFGQLGVAGSVPDFRPGPWGRSWQDPPKWTDLFAAGLSDALAAAIELAGGRRSSLGGDPGYVSDWDAALSWFVSSYPLLGALAATMTVVAEAELARNWDISIAAVNASVGEIYVNPLAALSPGEWRFVMAHEMLHAALRHGERAGGRDPYLWNLAADYVINGWLVEMGVGQLPDGLLYDPALAGQSAEQVYDRIAIDMRRHRKLATLRGPGRPDILGSPLPHSGEARRGMDLDELYRRALLTGLTYHDGSRGLVPAGLVDEIRALEHPPVPWDALLARWFDENVPATERHRTYGRASRRQSSTPDIPRPAWVRPTERDRLPTFGVVLDTSGSMDRQLLGKALGAIASYAAARDVPAARVVYCDAAAYDAGYVPVADIGVGAKVRGRGGTVLQPGVDLLERAEDFPSNGPILLITDAECDHVRVRREHAWLIPAGAALPFTPRGPVFRVR